MELTNRELIEKIEVSNIENTGLIIELIKRKLNKKFTDEEWEQLEASNSKRAALILDAVPKMGKSEMMSICSETIDELTDENR